MARAQKRTETALWPRRIFSAPMSAKTGVRVFAMEKNKNAKGIRLVRRSQEAGIRSQPEKDPSTDNHQLTTAARLWFYGLALRFKRSGMPKASSLQPKAFSIFPANPANRSGVSFWKPARMCS